MSLPGAPLKTSPAGALVNIGFKGPGRAVVYFGPRQAARVNRGADGRWTVARRDGPTLDTLEAAIDWLCTPPDAPLPLTLTLGNP